MLVLFFICIASLIFAVGIGIFLFRKRQAKADQDPQGRNRRRFSRVAPMDGEPVEIQIIGENFMEQIEARDISKGGISILVPHMFEGCRVDGELDLIISLPKTRPFMARATIRHTKSRDDETGIFGVKFTSIEEAHIQTVEDYVDDLMKNGNET
ncbi:MAG: PilZ domain-containing protein [Proteobacteria bacterium]|nr:PilZ domain-containing protein [Pseudomonadota bacterium]